MGKAPKRQGLRQGRQGSRTPTPVRDRIIELRRDGYSARQIADKLGGEGVEPVPNERTIRHIVAQHTAPATNPPPPETWYFADLGMSAEDAGIYLRTVAAYWAGLTAGRRSASSVTAVEAVADPVKAEAADIQAFVLAAKEIVAPLTARLLRSSTGHRYQRSVSHARWVVRLKRAVPEIPAHLAMGMAYDYDRADQAAKDPADLAALTVELDRELRVWLTKQEASE